MAIIQLLLRMIDQQEEHHFLLFINTKSGGCKGKQYLTVGENRLKLKSKLGFYVYVYLYDLFNPFQKETGLKTALELTKTCKNVNLIICGGDGTVLWVVSAAINAGINLDDVCFGIIPIGTGNDFSRSLGWGGSPISFSSEDIRQLRKTVQKWVKASKQKFDLWDVSISTFEGGKITPSSSNVEQEETKTELSKTFSNYVGIGIDARVSYHFQKNRTASKLINLALYACLGFCFCLKKKQKMHDKISQFSQSESQSQPEGFSSSQGEGEESQKVKAMDIKKMKLLQKNQSTDYSEIKLKKGYAGLVCLNCTSYMSGVMNIFNTKKIAAKNKTHADFTQQKFNDGKIEFVGFKNELALGLERFIHTAGKVSQGEGPYSIKFDPQKSKQTFVHIDGEAVLVERLKQIRITKSKLGQIRVLTKVE